MDHHHGPVGAALQSLGYVLRIERAAPFDLNRVDRRAEGFGNRDEAVAELAGDDDEDRIAGAENVDKRCFHHRRSGAGEDQNVMRRAEDRL